MCDLCSEIIEASRRLRELAVRLDLVCDEGQALLPEAFPSPPADASLADSQER